MLPVKISDDFFWVGSVNFDCVDFHGYSRSPRGTTHNAYVLKDKKNVLFDTVKQEHMPDMVHYLKNTINPEDIDYFVIHHTELDHSGGLEEMLRLCRPEKVFCSPMGYKSLEKHFDVSGWPLQAVKTGESINCGKNTIRFIEAPMLHWPDSMVSHIPEKKLLISNDIFGQNYATMERFADQVSPEIWEHTLREYYHNIILPYSGQVLKFLDAIRAPGMDIAMIAPDHGLVMRGEHAPRVLDLYRQYAEQKPKRRGLVVYDTMWHSTEKMAACIAAGLCESGVPSRIMPVKNFHPSLIMTELSQCGILAVGSPTHNNTVLQAVAGLLTYIKGLRPKNRLGAAFGSFGWSGEGAKDIVAWLESMKFEQPVPAVSCQYRPSADILEQCRGMGQALGRRLDEVLAGSD